MRLWLPVIATVASIVFLVDRATTAHSQSHPLGRAAFSAAFDSADSRAVPKLARAYWVRQVATGSPAGRAGDTRRPDRARALPASRTIRTLAPDAVAPDPVAPAGPPVARPVVASGIWVRPVTGPLVSPYGPREGRMHYGLDFANAMGDPILAAGDGVVIAAGQMGGYGNYVAISHVTPEGVFATLYAHMSVIQARAGEMVRAGQLIGLIGMTGDASGPHLHFEVHVGGLTWNYTNPEPWLVARGVPVR